MHDLKVPEKTTHKGTIILKMFLNVLTTEMVITMTDKTNTIDIKMTIGDTKTMIMGTPERVIDANKTMMGTPERETDDYNTMMGTPERVIDEITDTRGRVTHAMIKTEKLKRLDAR